MKELRPVLLAILGLVVQPAVWAQEPILTLEPSVCLPAAGNGLLKVSVEDDLPGSTLRLYFRRMNPGVEDFYYVVARPVGRGAYEAVLPVPEDRPFATPGEKAEWARWWRERELSDERGERSREGMREPRTWLSALDDEAFQSWLEQLQWEPVEYHATLLDAVGEEVAWSDEMKVVEVTTECGLELDPLQQGVGDNLILGETAKWQQGEEPFHWRCDGLATRIDPAGIWTADNRCRDGLSSLFADLEDEEETGTRDIITEEYSYRSVKVFYGTDRKRSFGGNQWVWDKDGDSGDVAFAGARGSDERLELGTCQVSIPLDHEVGVTESAGAFTSKDPAKHVLLLSVTPSSRDGFVAELATEVAAAGEKAALVFIHGYNVSFENAARRTAQIAYDLGFEGAPIMYSWPSQGELAGYTIDEANIRWTVPHLQEFLRLVIAESGAEQIHVIAHSMGNRAFTEVLRRFAAEAGPGAPRFNQIALVAPDVDADVFRQEIAPAIRCSQGTDCVADRVTLYASRKDKALHASKKLHGHPRAGDLSEGVLLAPGVEMIDASEVDTSLLRAISLGHSYFADKPSVITDLARTLSGQSPGSNERSSGLIPTSSGSGRYWKLRRPSG